MPSPTALLRDARRRASVVRFALTCAALVGGAPAVSAQTTVPTLPTIPALASPADRAWAALKRAQDTPPEPLKQNPTRMLTQDEIGGYYAMLADRAGGVADAARQFAEQYPDDRRVADAREVCFDMLHISVGLGGAARVAELEAATARRMSDPTLDEAGRFKLALRQLHSTVGGRQYAGDEAMRAELETRARRLAKDFPGHPEGLEYLLKMARTVDAEKSGTLANEILDLTPDPRVRAECNGLIARTAALGKPLDLHLSLDGGRSLDLTQMRGKVVLLFLWDSQSPFSQKALWAVNHLYQTHHAEGLEVWGLNFDPLRGQADALLKDNQIAWPQYFDPAHGAAIQQRFGVYAVPTVWAVDKKGVLRELKCERDPEGIVKRLLAE